MRGAQPKTMKMVVQRPLSRITRGREGEGE